jgi:hypothetical protein
MINEIKLFLFVLCLVFELKFIFQFIYQLTRENPEPLKIKEMDKTLLYFTTAYIITYILI